MSRCQDQKGAYEPEAREALRASDPVMRRLIDSHPSFDPETWRRYGPTIDPFGTLVRVVIGQQVSTSAARAILGRLSALFGGKLPNPSELLAVEEEELRSVGLSRQKLYYLRNLIPEREGWSCCYARPSLLPSLVPSSRQVFRHYPSLSAKTLRIS